MKIVIDSDALIKLTKSGAKELITECFDVVIPYLTPSFLIVYLLHTRKISKKYAEKYIYNLKMYISEEEYLTAIEEVLKWAK
jgi:hypothetical protein